jgi:AcrR family transcriptional regulator
MKNSFSRDARIYLYDQLVFFSTLVGRILAMTAEANHTGWPIATRRRLLDAAIILFERFSFAGTSLQMIADELGLTKAAIYYHFRTRDQLLLAVMEPLLLEISDIVDTAEQQRGAEARAESMVTGYAGVVARNRALAAVTTFDPSVGTVLRSQSEWNAVIDRQLALLAAGSRDDTKDVSATFVMTGLAGAASGAPKHLDDDTLRSQLVAIGKRTLGLSSPA